MTVVVFRTRSLVLVARSAGQRATQLNPVLT